MIMPAGAGEAPLIHDSIISSAGAFTHLPFLFIYGNLRDVILPSDGSTKTPLDPLKITWEW